MFSLMMGTSAYSGASAQALAVQIDATGALSATIDYIPLDLAVAISGSSALAANVDLAAYQKLAVLIDATSDLSMNLQVVLVRGVYSDAGASAGRQTPASAGAGSTRGTYSSANSGSGRQ